MKKKAKRKIPVDAGQREPILWAAKKAFETALCATPIIETIGAELLL